LRLLHERADHDDPAADRRDVKRSGNSIATGQPQLPKLALQVFDMRLAQTFQSGPFDAIGKP